MNFTLSNSGARAHACRRPIPLPSAEMGMRPGTPAALAQRGCSGSLSDDSSPSSRVSADARFSRPVSPSPGNARKIVLAVAACALLAAGCAGPGPRLMPASPARMSTSGNGAHERWFDINADGRLDYAERYARSGRLAAIGYDRNQDGDVEEEVVLDRVPERERRYLVLLLDSVPYSVAQALWRAGLFRYCAPPSRVISPFPVMTDLSFSEFFGVSPSPGVESEYYDGRQIRGGYWVYMNEGNANWLPHTDYHLPQINHGSAYLDVEPWFDHELRRIQEQFLAGDTELFIGYCMGTSGLGATQGREGARKGMLLVDRMCRQLIHQTRGRVRPVLLSDHGHFFTAEESRRLPLRDLLQDKGYCIADHLRGPRDLVMPEFEMVSIAAIWTQQPAAVASDVVNVQGVDLVMHREGEKIVVVSENGRATIEKSGDAFRYVPEQGDPLRLSPVLARLEQVGRIGSTGLVDDQVLCRAALDGIYPDGVARIWRAFHGLVENTPDLIVSLEEGWHCGSALQTSLINLVGVHGNLKQASTSGFAMTSVGSLPAVSRMVDLHAAMRNAGVPLKLISDSTSIERD